MTRRWRRSAHSARPVRSRPCPCRRPGRRRRPRARVVQASDGFFSQPPRLRRRPQSARRFAYCSPSSTRLWNWRIAFSYWSRWSHTCLKPTSFPACVRRSAPRTRARGATPTRTSSRTTRAARWPADSAAPLAFAWTTWYLGEGLYGGGVVAATRPSPRDRPGAGPGRQPPLRRRSSRRPECVGQHQGGPGIEPIIVGAGRTRRRRRCCSSAATADEMVHRSCSYPSGLGPGRRRTWTCRSWSGCFAAVGRPASPAEEMDEWALGLVSQGASR